MCECPTMYNEEVVTARKPHRCCECGTQIAKGEQYESVSGMWDGRFDRSKTCIPCMEIRKKATEGIRSGRLLRAACLWRNCGQYLLDGSPDTDKLYAAVHAPYVNAKQHKGTAGGDSWTTWKPKAASYPCVRPATSASSAK